MRMTSLKMTAMLVPIVFLMGIGIGQFFGASSVTIDNIRSFLGARDVGYDEEMTLSLAIPDCVNVLHDMQLTELSTLQSIRNVLIAHSKCTTFALWPPAD